MYGVSVDDILNVEVTLILDMTNNEARCDEETLIDPLIDVGTTPADRVSPAVGLFERALASLFLFLGRCFFLEQAIGLLHHGKPWKELWWQPWRA